MDFEELDEKVKEEALNKFGDNVEVILRYGSSLFPEEFCQKSDIDFFVITKKDTYKELQFSDFNKKFPVSCGICSKKDFLNLLEKGNPHMYYILYANKVVYSFGRDLEHLKKQFKPDRKTIKAEIKRALIKYNLALNIFFYNDKFEKIEKCDLLNYLYKSLKGIYRALAWEKGLMVFDGKQIRDYVYNNFNPEIAEAYKEIFNFRKKRIENLAAEQKLEVIKTSGKVFGFAWEKLNGKKLPEAVQILSLIKEYNIKKPYIFFDLNSDLKIKIFLTEFKESEIRLYEFCSKLKQNRVFAGKKAEEKFQKLHTDLFLEQQD